MAQDPPDLEPDEWADWDQFEGGYDFTGDYTDDFTGDYTDDYTDTYNGGYGQWAEPVRAARRPWHRNPRVLAALIGAASASLAVSVVLLLTTDTFGDSPARLRPAIRTTAVSAAPSEPPQVASETGESTAAPETSSEPTTPEAEQPGAEGAVTEAELSAEPSAEPAAEPSAGAPARGQEGGSDQPEGPRINVTRSPMSFTPGTAG